MRYFFLCLICLPLCAQAGVRLADCDKQSYEVIVRNGGAMRIAQVTPQGSLQEYGPQVSFQIKGGREMIATNPEEEFCIWSGTIEVQRLSTVSNAMGY